MNLKRLLNHKPGCGVLLLGAGDILSLSVARSLAKVGIDYIHEFSVNPVPVEMSKNSRYLISYNTYDSYESLNPSYLKKRYSEYSKLVLLPITVEAIRWMSKFKDTLASSFHLPSIPDPDCINLVSNKWLLHRWLKNNGFSSPKTVLLNDKNESFKQKFVGMGFPQILKSKTEIPFKNILYIESPEGLKEIDKRIKGTPANNILQEYIPGDDRDISLLAYNGKVLAYTMQTPVKKRKLRYATSVKFFRDPKFLKIVEKIIAGLKWNGIAHLDFRFNKDTGEYYLIDFNARYWGTLLGSVCAGVNMPFLHVLQALNKDKEIKREFSRIKPVTFMMNRDAIKELYNKLFIRKERTTEFRLRNSELRFSLKDPLPEIYRRYSSPG